MPRVKKNIQSCYFCGKRPQRTYYVETTERKYFACSDCEYYFSVMKDLYELNPVRLKRLITVFPENRKHCTTCFYYREHRPEYCRQDMWTGIGDRHSSEYPESYANYGCNYYLNLHHVV